MVNSGAVRDWPDARGIWYALLLTNLFHFIIMQPGSMRWMAYKIKPRAYHFCGINYVVSSLSNEYSVVRTGRVEIEYQKIFILQENNVQRPN